MSPHAAPRLRIAPAPLGDGQEMNYHCHARGHTNASPSVGNPPKGWVRRCGALASDRVLRSRVGQ
jgi:hypothetical protein